MAVPSIQAAAPLLVGEPRQMCASLRRAWEQFVADGSVGVRDPVRSFILERWQWCVESSIDPHKIKAPEGLQADEIASRLRYDDFAIAGSRVLSDFSHVVEDRGHVIVLADAQGSIFYEVGDWSVARALEQVNFAPGGLWCERAVGPNGIGTPLATGNEGFIFGPEHFCEGWQAWVCYGSPVRDPVTRRIVGAVDVSGRAPRLDRATLNFTTSLARSIERLLAAVSLEKRQILTEEYIGATRRRPKDTVIAVDESGCIVHFSGSSPDLGEEPRLCVGQPISAALPEIEIPSAAEMLRAQPGREQERDFGPLRVRYLPVTYHERFIGTVLTVRSVENRFSASTRSLANVSASNASGDETRTLFTFDDLIGTSPAIREVVRVGMLAAKSDKNVLLTGETGSGKELLAQAIHSSSVRSSGPFVAINCAAIPSELVESELFGYAPGAFTGARRHGARGRFEQANGGTIFLDEISAMPLPLQGKLLRVVENRALSKLGGSGAVPLNVRIIAASNEDVMNLVEQGRLRRDLYYRLNVLGVRCPPLRERVGDVIPLASLFLARECVPKDRQPLYFSPEVERVMRSYSWPGNIRELKNLCARWVELCTGPAISLDDLPLEMRAYPADPRPHEESRPSLLEMQNNVVVTTLRECGDNVSEAARRLGVSRTTLYQKLRSLGLRQSRS